MSATKVALYTLASGFVLDRSVFVGLDVAALAMAIELIRAEKTKELLVVDNANTFFTADNLLALIKAGDDSYKLVAEQAGLNLRDLQVAAIQTAEAVTKGIVEAMTPLVPPYPFDKVPASWSIVTDLNINKSCVTRRRTNPQGDDAGYGVTQTSLKKIWVKACPLWDKGTANGQKLYDLQIAGSYRDASIYSDRVVIGCQSFRRYELEQLAVHLGWDFH